MMGWVTMICVFLLVTMIVLERLVFEGKLVTVQRV